MPRPITFLLAALSAAALPVLAAAAEPVRLTLEADTVVNPIDVKVYGHFLEHIYHSVNGGLWGEMVWNRSFEQASAGGGQWRVDNGEVVQTSPAADVRLPFGDPAWRDYEFSLEAQKTASAEGFLVLFRVAGDEDFYWVNLGGWGNKRHAIERGRKDEGRHRPVGPAADGAIRQGTWYAIRVRCEGRHIQVFLDGKPLIDFTDDAKGHAAGRVGVGTWATRARFRNLKVTSLDGKVLFEGLPGDLAQPSPAKFWEAYGQGAVAMGGQDALNGDLCQRIASEGGEAGIQQTPLCVRRGDACAGSLWVRGEAPGGLVIRLRDGDTTLAEQTLPAPTGEWQERAIRLEPKASAENATLQVGVRGKGAVWLDQVSLMPESARAAGGFRPDLLKAIADLRPPIIRWPGGCFASAYRWKDGIGPQHRRGKYPREIWDDVDVNSFGTDEFIAMCRKVRAEPLIVVNIGTPRWNGDVPREDFIREVQAWIQYANGPADSEWGKVRAANGHPEPYGVAYWEVDNETWHMGAEAYAEAVRAFVPKMKEIDPSIRIAACGSGGYGDNVRGLEWNRTIIERCADLIDYLSIHHYERPDNFADGPRAYEEFFLKTAEMIAQSKNPKVKIYVSEWNAQTTDWRTGLYAGGLLNAFERCGDVLEIGGPALFLRHVSASRWDNAFINFDHRTWFPAPNYVVMKLWRDHYAPERIAMTGDAGPLNAVAARAAGRDITWVATGADRAIVWKAVNPTAEAVAVELTVAGRFQVNGAVMQQVAPGALAARNTLEAPGAVKPAAAEAKIDGQTVRVTLPPLSAAVVTILAR